MCAVDTLVHAKRARTNAANVNPVLSSRIPAPDVCVPDEAEADAAAVVAVTPLRVVELAVTTAVLVAPATVWVDAAAVPLLLTTGTRVLAAVTAVEE